MRQLDWITGEELTEGLEEAITKALDDTPDLDPHEAATAAFVKELTHNELYEAWLDVSQSRDMYHRIAFDVSRAALTRCVNEEIARRERK